MTTTESDRLREEFIEECHRLGCSIFDKRNYDAIISILQGRSCFDKKLERSLRNTKSRFKIVEKGDEINLFRLRPGASDHRRIVHSLELFDVISSVHRAFQPCSATFLYSYLFERYNNISFETCKVFLRCYKRCNPLRIFREGYLSIIDMRSAPDKQQKWIFLYQDFPLGKIYARALRSCSIKSIAMEMLKIFLADGFPEKLYSDSKRKFFSRVVSHILSLESSATILYKRSHFIRHQRAILKAFKRKLRVWIKDNVNKGWSIGIYYCAHLIEKTFAPETTDASSDEDTESGFLSDESDDHCSVVAISFRSGGDRARDARQAPTFSDFPVTSRELTSTCLKEIRQVGLRVVPTPGKGECLFHTVRNHFIEFGREIDDIGALRKRVVDFLLHDESAISFASFFMGDVDIRKLYECEANDPTTWPTIDCFYVICQIFHVKVTLFASFAAGKLHEVRCFWPINGSPPSYPPVPAKDWICARYVGDKVNHIELLLPSKRLRKNC